MITLTTNAKQTDDTVSLSSLQSPNATKIKVPYQRIIEIERERANSQRASFHRVDQPAPALAEASQERTSSEMSLQEDIESLSKRLASISQYQQYQKQQQQQQLNGGLEQKLGPTQHFDYKTMVANVPARQVIDSYNVQIKQQNSPFHSRLQQAQMDKGASNQPTTMTLVNTDQSMTTTTPPDNNNEANFNINHYVKYHATPALVDQSLQSSNGDDEEDRLSQNSSCSLQSARTYNIRKLDRKQEEWADAGRETRAEGDSQGASRAGESGALAFDENGNGNGKPTAWIFDPRDNSSTAIVAPERPKRPETPRVDSRTEELNQSRGGRSYYLELVETGEKAAPARRQRPSSIDSLYSRWNSQGALNHPACRPLSSANARQNPTRQADSSASQNRLVSSRAGLEKAAASTATTAATTAGKSRPFMQRRQLPFGGPPSSLGDRSKSSSCLLSVTKPSKYSIYGGYRKPGESNRSVPRLSYSRAIGPRSSRVDTTPAAPSRYLKMR